MSPADAERGRAALAYRSGDNAIQVAGALNELRLAERRIRPEPTIDPVLTRETGPLFDGDSGELVMVVCEVDPWVLVEDVDGVETVVDDAIVAERSEIVMRFADRLWRIDERNLLGRWEGTECPAD